jgi:integrase
VALRLKTGSLLNPSNLRNRSLKRIKARSGVREDLRFHDLRHTCAMLLLSQNTHPKFVQELLGDATVAITLDPYCHVIPGMGDYTACALEGALEEDLSEEKGEKDVSEGSTVFSSRYRARD